MKSKLLRKQINTFEHCGWTVHQEPTYFYIETHSPKGEDLAEDFEYGTSIVDQLQVKVNNFDPEEHAAMWYNARPCGQPTSLRELLNDADAIHEMLKTLLQKFKEV